MTGYQDETIIPVDTARILADPALADMRDGPARRFLLALSTELDHDPGEAPPLLLVRRA